MIPKYRAWDKARNEMNYKVMVGNCDTDDENWTCPIIWIEEKKDWLHFDDYDSIMQSTGLKDKNGKEIFEGDIVRTTRFLGRADEIGGFYEYDKEFIGIVKQLEGSWVIDTGSDAVCLWTEIEENEIIGNIYENKEFGGRK
ncbi:phage protein [Streptococcus pneumoniae]|uniref:YopX family protein n=1 Tax=Streptococcus pneumoniae TaxID=1313 RepID=UPI0005DC0BAF|nr:YopX family protein [Streptococcus pneumoniae]CJE49373.1 phage protein [Streptococcus pneumoniae]VLV82949.1 phage protein [Streptococcus pneumoniae]VLY26298.1 phage protein [Streptococcus pneumoniae]VMP22467.1 phage protein [Streptococcus pneumoniae]VNA65868.1 phage protein [Streptococcus pneumoniae]